LIKGTVLSRKIIAFIAVMTLLLSLGVPVLAAEIPVLEGRVVILDAGHGVGSSNVYEGYDEQVVMLKLARKIKVLLEEAGATVLMTRNDPETVPLPKCAALINIWALEAVRESRMEKARMEETDENEDHAAGIREINRLLGIMQSIADEPQVNGRIYMNRPFNADRKIHQELARVFEFQKDPVIRDRFMVISLHSNSTENPINTGVSGATVFHISNSHRNTAKYYSSFSYGEQSRHFGEILLAHIDETGGIRKREAAVDNLFMNREHNVPSVLVENGFHTNARDRSNLLDDRYLDKLAAAYLHALIDYYAGFPLPVPVQLQIPVDEPDDAYLIDPHLARQLDIIKMFFDIISAVT